MGAPMRGHLALIAVVILTIFSDVSIAQKSTATLMVRATVVRSCSVDRTVQAGQPVQVTCSRDATPGVMTSTSPLVIPVSPLRPIDVAAPKPVQTSASAPTTAVTPAPAVGADARANAPAPAAAAARPQTAMTETGVAPQAASTEIVAAGTSTVAAAAQTATPEAASDSEAAAVEQVANAQGSGEVVSAAAGAAASAPGEGEAAGKKATHQVLTINF